MQNYRVNARDGKQVVRIIGIAHTHTHTHTHTHSPTSYSLKPILLYPLTYLPLAYSLIHLSLAYLLTLLLAYSHAYSLTHSLSHLHTPYLTHSLTHTHAYMHARTLLFQLVLLCCSSFSSISPLLVIFSSFPSLPLHPSMSTASD